MERNYKKGFTLAEMLIVFLLVSIMLAVFAPTVTKKAKKKMDPNCPNGYKSVVAEYAAPGAYGFVVPKNIVDKATITLVGAGGKGSDSASAGSAGNGGSAGGYLREEQKLAIDATYTVVVGAGGGKSGEYASRDTSFSGGEGEGVINLTAARGTNGANSSVTGGVNSVFGSNIIGGAPGTVCDNAQNCDPHGKPGSGFERTGLNDLGFFAGTGGGGGGYSGATDIKGVGGFGGDGYARIEYKIRCNKD